MSTPSPLDEELDPQRLTETSGGLDGGRVTEVTVETSRTTIVSTVQRLRLRYTGGEGPATLFRKQPRGDLDATLRSIVDEEVGFYATVAPVTPAGGLARCDGIAGAEGRLGTARGLDRHAHARRRVRCGRTTGSLRHLERGIQSL
jgi:hypothetical protein